MITRLLISNDDLYFYLCNLAADLRNCGAPNAAFDPLLHASKFITGSSSEFLHESQMALREALEFGASMLTADQTQQASLIIEQIEDAFRKVGGS